VRESLRNAEYEWEELGGKANEEDCALVRRNHQIASQLIVANFVESREHSAALAGQHSHKLRRSGLREA
jgi:hypothetical protein